MTSFEQAFGEVERTAEAAAKSAADMAKHGRALVKAARSGNLADIERCRDRLDDALAILRQDVANVKSGWPFTEEEEARRFKELYADELREIAAGKGLTIHERDGALISWPSIVRILPTDRAVRIDRKKVSTVRPSWLVDLLVRNRGKSSGMSPQRFLEMLYGVYKRLLGDGAADMLPPGGGRVVLLSAIHEIITVLPGVRRDYDRSDFARDLYALDSNGPRETRDGARVSLPASTGTRRRSRDVFSFVGPDGDVVEYYGIRFDRSGA